MPTPLPAPDHPAGRDERQAPARRNVPDPELIDRVASSTGLSVPEAERVIDDVLAFYREPVTDFVRRRHADLQLHGTRNAQAFAQIAEELRTRPVAAPDLSERQLRRLIYG